MLKEKVPKFNKWLTNNGAEILPTTNEWEQVRFRGKEVGIIYKSGKFSNKYAEDTYIAFKENKSWDGRPIKTGRRSSYKKQKVSLIKRDGDRCFFCNKKLGDDITVEHLLSLTSGGKNTLGNMVLAHEKCNQYAENKTVVEKVNIAIKNRCNNNKSDS